MNGIQIDREEHQGWSVVSVSGEIDLASAPELHEALNASLTSGGHTVLDLSKVTFLDSTGLGVLVQANQRADALGATLRLVVAESNVRRVIDMTGLDRVFSIHQSLETATR